MKQNTQHALQNGSLLLLIISVWMLVADSCSASRGVKSVSDSLNDQEDYHADNDIAMIVKSIVDAVCGGEPLDTAEYKYEGVLTDGEGHPLYTDIQGSPGEWEVDVISSTTAVVRNIYLGDLLPDYLESYLTATLNLGQPDLIASTEFNDDDEADLVVYDLKGGYLRLETRAAVAPNGLEGPLMSIVVTKTPPENRVFEE